jgi:hypothetical protein
MKATITSFYFAAVHGFTDPHPFFGFDLEEHGAVIRSDIISLRTARILAQELGRGAAFVKMLKAIMECPPSDYGLLVGQVFED